MASGFRGAIFDVDGVLVDSPHERAWRDALKEPMETQWSDVQPQTSYSPERFTPKVYQQVMSSKPRFSGAQAALEYLDVPDALRFILAVKTPGSASPQPPLKECGPLPAPDPSGHLRRRERSGVRAGDARADPPRVLRRRHLGP
ncbi:MAG TPA: hypothetical protein VF376_13895 [Thermoanaerobaculia bacterium]